MYKILISDSIDKEAKNIFEKNNIKVDIKINLSEQDIVKIITEVKTGGGVSKLNKE